MVRGKKIGLGEFLGDQAAAYIPEAALPSGPRMRDDDDTNYRRGGPDRFGSDRFEREPSRSEQSDQWRGDRRGGFGNREDGASWRGGERAGPSRYERPSRDFQPEERPAHMRLNLQRRSEGLTGDARSQDVRAGGDKFASAFGGRGDRFGGAGDRFGGAGERLEGRAAGRFARDDVSASLSNLRVNERVQVEPPTDKKLLAKQKREERKKKAEEERQAAEEAKRQAAEEKKKAEEQAAKKAEKDRETMKQVLNSGKKGEELAALAKELFAKSGRVSGAVLFEAVTNAAEDVAKSSANWIAMPAYGELLKLGMEDADKKDQMNALYALQVFLNKYDFPKGLMEKCFMALYSLDIIEDVGFFEYKYDVDGDVPGRMKAIIQTSSWLTWLETPEEESDEEEDDE